MQLGRTRVQIQHVCGNAAWLTQAACPAADTEQRKHHPKLNPHGQTSPLEVWGGRGLHLPKLLG
eukprot:8037823-Lingulodinium_polyedra.AAC.1